MKFVWIGAGGSVSLLFGCFTVLALITFIDSVLRFDLLRFLLAAGEIPQLADAVSA